VQADEQSHGGFPWRPCLLVFVVALGVRLFFLTLIPGDALRPSTDWELDAIAMSLVTEGQFANPYIEPTGPTAHLAPIPPMILALMYKLFGITMVAGIAGWIFRMVAQSAIWGLLPWIGERTGLGWKAGFTGGLAGALWPQWLAHGEALASVLLGLLVVAIVRRWDSIQRSSPESGSDAGLGPGVARDPGSPPRPAGSLLLGAAFGVSFHVQPVFLVVLLGYLAFELWRRSDRRKWVSAGLVLLGALLVSIPWGVRNYRAFDAVFFIRSNFGLELRMGNHESATASIDDPHFNDWPPHPRTHVEDAIKIQEWGEVPYMRRSGREAREWIASNPGAFTRLTAERVRYFWLGSLDDPGMALVFVVLAGLAILGVVRALPELPATRAAAMLIPLLTYPLVYYLVPWQHRYRFPIEWILFLLAGAALWSWRGTRSTAHETADRTEHHQQT